MKSSTVVIGNLGQRTVSSPLLAKCHSLITITLVLFLAFCQRVDIIFLLTLLVSDIQFYYRSTILVYFSLFCINTLPSLLTCIGKVVSGTFADLCSLTCSRRRLCRMLVLLNYVLLLVKNVWLFSCIIRVPN